MKALAVLIILYVAVCCDADPRLLYVDGKTIWSSTFKGTEKKALVDTKNVQDFDFDSRTKTIFWSDYKDAILYKADLEKNKRAIPIKLVDFINVQSLAVDWVFNHIYVANDRGGLNLIEAINFAGNTRVVLYSELKYYVRGIAIDPLDAWLFWTETNQANTVRTIRKFGMNGEDKQTIVTGLDKAGPITVDLEQKRIYWAELSSISYSDYKGENRKMLMKGLSNPGYVSLFENWVYYGIGGGKLYEANKLSGNETKVILTTNSGASPFVKVYHPDRPTVKVTCQEFSCLCLPTPKLDRGYPMVRCTCPSNDKYAHTCNSPNIAEGPPVPTTNAPKITTTTEESTPEPSDASFEDLQAQMVKAYKTYKGQRIVFCFSRK